MTLKAWEEAERRVQARRRRERYRKYQGDPEAYAREVLRVTWWAKQREIAESVRDNKRTLVKAAFGTGKTHVSGGLANWWYDSFPSSKIVTTAPTGNQVRNLLWVEIRGQRKTQPPAATVQIKDETNPEHLAVGYSPRRDRRSEMGEQTFQGMHSEYLLVVFDEGAAVEPPRYDTAEDLIVSEMNRWLVIGNPIVTGGPFYDAATRYRDKWNVITITALEHPNIAAGLAGEPDPYPGAVSLGWLEDKLSNPEWCERIPEYQEGCFEFPPGSGDYYWPSPIAEAKILARFPSTIDDAVWSMSWLELARQRELEWGEGDVLTIGVDPGRYGSDPTAMHARIGPCSLGHWTWARKDTMETAGRVRGHLLEIFGWFEDLLEAEYRAMINVDLIGMPGVTDRLIEVLAPYEGVRVNGISVSENAIDREKYKTRRDELWFNAAARARNGDLDLTRLDEDTYNRLSSQMTPVKFKYDSSGRKIVESKDAMKKRIQRSPDDADAFNLAYYGIGGISMAEGDRDGAMKKSSTWQHEAPEQSRWSPWATGGGGRWRMG